MIQFLFVLATGWVAICIIDLIFKTCLLYPYIVALEMTGLIIKPFYLKCYLTQFNKRFSRWGLTLPKIFNRWFDVGVIVTCGLIIPAVGLLLMSALKLIYIEKRTQVDAQILQPVVPGVNLPLSQLFYYLITIFVCSMFHEIGHALAAVREGIQIDGCGFFILFILPAAFVNLRAEQLVCSSSWQQLRIFCAGIWHNVVIVGVSLLLLWSNPILLSPFFRSNLGVSVISVSQSSGVAGPAGLFSGDQIQAVNNCRVDHMDDWKLCLQEIALNPQHGYCASKSFLAEQKHFTYESNDPEDCCTNNSSSHLCFIFHDVHKTRSCLPVRKLVTSSPVCTTNEDCHWKDELCVIPVLQSHIERLIKIERYDKDPVLYLGSTSELFASVTVTQWVAKSRYFSVHLIYMYETLLKYLISFSAALAALNLIPCPALDGKWLCQILVNALLSSSLPKSSHRALVVWLLEIFGTILITANIGLGLYQLFYAK